MTKRTERDSIGTLSVPSGAYFGVHTARAIENFPITGVTLSHFPEFIAALCQVKLAACRANRELGALESERAEFIEQACRVIITGAHHDSFVVDMIQGGAGTSTNMNANEVIANLAAELAGRDKGVYDFIHPNDHVNCSQSTNDVYPTAIRLAVLAKAEGLIREQRALLGSFAAKARAFADIHKVGRTQLQDAVPMTVGREFASYAAALTEEISRLEDLSKILRVVNLGGTAIGTSINAPDGYAELSVKYLSEISGHDLRSASDLIDASSDMGALVSYSGLLRRVAIKVSKICNDLRLLSSGPRAGLGEIVLPAVQAGSSIMPGKVNPVIPEVVSQVAYQVVGNDLTITMAAEAGQLQLNAMEPVIAYNLLESIRILENALRTLRVRCVDGITVDRDRCAALLAGSLVLVTALVPTLGYETSATVAKDAQKNGRTVEDIVVERGLMTRNDFRETISRSLAHL
ncbi:aspartate ammonia-lyase [uncultured Paracoccus sp.]|jgi:aspartate ammonia-lyase|uniref:aspartate ammonia-lyase n=1 Tax=uncultured Paracoccus sp. TaxID=189685 RepID=UPI0026361327|nr:aspartate ammonia-lyase [uncultured Paracoccus sp.]